MGRKQGGKGVGRMRGGEGRRDAVGGENEDIRVSMAFRLVLWFLQVLMCRNTTGLHSRT